MHFQEDFLYHIYNQGNADFILFKDDEDYNVFLGKMERWILPNCDLLAYCLMPNHFHFMVRANQQSVKERKLGLLQISELSNGMRLLQSQYALAYNEKYRSRGSVFRPKAKAKPLNDELGEYALKCFFYILLNPVKARLCQDVFDWKFSSASSMLNPEINPIINMDTLKSHIDLDWNNFGQVMNQWIVDERSMWEL